MFMCISYSKLKCGHTQIYKNRSESINVPLHENQDTGQQIIILSSKFSQSTDRSWGLKNKAVFQVVTKSYENTGKINIIASIFKIRLWSCQRMRWNKWNCCGTCWVLLSITLCITCTNSLALQHHSVEDEADVLWWLRGAWSLFAQKVQDLCS